jgi:hypothetical protein
MAPTRGSPTQRRRGATPLALMLAGWALAVAPVAHPLLAHGTPFLRLATDEVWVHHEAAHGSPGRGVPLPSGHHHAPGAPEHLQLPLLAAIAPPVLERVLLAVRPPLPVPGIALSLPRRWSEEQPQAP